jgi:hypothetical protein
LDVSNPLEVKTRVPLHDLPGFHAPAPNEKIKKVDVGLVAGSLRTLVTAKWSIRADREEQFMSDFQTYERLESIGQDFAYVLVTNEFDAARLRAACERRRQNAPLFTHVVHINPAAVDVVYREAQSDGAVALREHIATGRLTSFANWLDQIAKSRDHFWCAKNECSAISSDFDFTGDALFEIDRFRRKEGRQIRPLTVREILDEELTGN